MAKLTEQQQKQLDELTALKDAPDDGDDAVWVENADGHRTRLTGARADAWLAKNGYSDAAGDASTQGDPLTAKKTAPGTAAPAKKTAPAKKAAAGAPPEATAAEDGAGDELPQDDPAGGRSRRAFF